MEYLARCPWAIKYGTTLTTRCSGKAGHLDVGHEGPGLAQFPYQRVHWLAGDRREFITDRDDRSGWESVPCPVPSAITGAACLLPDGHPQDAQWRFHRYAKPSGGLEA